MSARLCAQLLLVTAGVGAFGTLMPQAQAGSATADSIWDSRNALQRAMQGMPTGATVTRQQCQTLDVGLDNTRYRCTVWWSDPPARQLTPSETP